MTINRKNDYAFKRIFGHEDSKDILARFLSVVLDAPIEADELTLIHTELSPDYLADKASVLDIQVRRSAFHEKMNVEMQRADEGNLERRVLHYWSRSYVEELKEGQDYAELPRQVNIVITDFDVFDWRDKGKFHGIFHVRDQEEGMLFSDALEIHFLELPKLRRQPAKKDWSAEECWGLYLDNLGGEIMESIAEREPMIRKAITIEDVFTKNEEDRRFYELREKGRRDYTNAISTAVKRGMAQGMEKGIVQGMEKGMVQGMEKGKLEMARNLLNHGISPDIIAKSSGLTLENIDVLRKG